MMQQKYLILLCTIILTALCFFYLSSKSINAKIAKINVYDKHIKVEQEKLNSAKVLNEQLKEISKIIFQSMTDKGEFSSEEVNTFIKKLTDMADKYKIAVHSIFPKVVSSTSTYLVEQQYTMILNCTFVQMGRFLSQMESFDNLIKIKTLDITPLSKDRKDSNIEIATRYKVTLELSTLKIIKER
jgi:archaellum biogenesis ATPase FlaH